MIEVQHLAPNLVRIVDFGLDGTKPLILLEGTIPANPGLDEEEQKEVVDCKANILRLIEQVYNITEAREQQRQKEDPEQHSQAI